MTESTGTAAPSIVRVQDLSKSFTASGGSQIHAVRSVSFDVPRGSCVGLVGESGSGKSTVGRLVLRLTAPSSGSIEFDGIDITALPQRTLRPLRPRMQMVFQDPNQALNPRARIGTLIAEGLASAKFASRTARHERVAELLRMVELPVEFANRRPSQLSGGQLQRVCIARALAPEPTFLVLDEPTSSLDLSVRAGILATLRDLRERLDLSYLLISHDLPTVAAQCDHVVVMYLGEVVETGPADQVLGHPQHSYTRALLSAYLPPDPDSRVELFASNGADRSAG